MRVLLVGAGIVAVPVAIVDSKGVDDPGSTGSSCIAKAELTLEEIHLDAKSAQSVCYAPGSIRVLTGAAPENIAALWSDFELSRLLYEA